MALGARRGNVVALVIREALVLVLTGVIVGLPCAAALSRIAGTQLYGVEPNDWVSMTLATSLLTAVALIAAYLPARSAARYDPARVLRME